MRVSIGVDGKILATPGALVALAVGWQLVPFRWIGRKVLHWYLWPAKSIWLLFTFLLLAEVTHVDLAAREVITAQAEPLPYDYLILAPGASTHYFGHDEWAHFAPGLKSIDDAVESAT